VNAEHVAVRSPDAVVHVAGELALVRVANHPFERLALVGMNPDEQIREGAWRWLAKQLAEHG
jgi:hypothetical protein